MPGLNFPPYKLRLKEDHGRKLIFDPVRRKFVVLTPEEWVRQHMIAFLLDKKHVPVGLIGVEKQLLINKMPRRFDITIYDRQGRPLALVECKAPAIELTEKVFDQAARYNLQLNVDYCIVTNGMTTFCCRMDYGNCSYVFMEDIPEYDEMLKYKV